MTLKNGDAIAFGFAAKDYDANASQGVHHEKLLAIADEATGVATAPYEGLESCVTGEDNRFIAFGNPIYAGNEFEKACRQSAIEIPVWNHPNVAWAYEKIYEDEKGIHRLRPEVAAKISSEDPKKPIKQRKEWPESFPQKDPIPGAVSIEWIEQTRIKHKEGSPFWLSRVEAIFPRDKPGSYIPHSLFQAARDRYLADPAVWELEARDKTYRHGLDVGGGVDAISIVTWQGPILRSVLKFPSLGDGMDAHRAAGYASDHNAQYPGIWMVDAGGPGLGTYGEMHKAGMNCIKVMWGSKRLDPTKSASYHEADSAVEFPCLKHEHAYLMREAFVKGEVAIDPNIDPALLEEMAEDWRQTQIERYASQFKLEAKKEVRRKLGRSPDVGDAGILGFNAPEIGRYTPAPVQHPHGSPYGNSHQNPYGSNISKGIYR